MSHQDQPPPTILALKTSFLANQTRLLAQPLTPSRQWTSANTSSDTPLPQKAVDDALVRVNQLLTQHARRVHAPQATRHVAEQIDRLYWDALARAEEQDEAANSLTVGHNLNESGSIEALPSAWEREADVERYPMEAARYEELVARLRELDERRTKAQASVDRLRGIGQVLEPFVGDEDGRGVQENLVTRDGEVERELERMRMLLVRVSGRVGQVLERRAEEGLGTGGGGGHGEPVVVDDVEVEEQRKVAELVRRFGREGAGRAVEGGGGAA